MKTVKREAGRIVLVALLLCLDQGTKWYALHYLKGTPGQSVIGGVLALVYAENTGAAFSSFVGNNTALIVAALCVFCLLIYLYTRLPAGAKWNKLKYALTVLMAGAAGNLIDRFLHGFVVDFIYFIPINFPKFNIADSCIVLSVIALFILLCFVYSENDLKEIALLPKRKPPKE